MDRLEEIKRAYGYDYRLSKDTYPYWLINRVEELYEELCQVVIYFNNLHQFTMRGLFPGIRY